MKTLDKYKGSELWGIDYRANIYYKQQWVNKNCLISDKEYEVTICKSFDSEGYPHTYYEISPGYSELDKMLEERAFNEAVRKEVEYRAESYYAQKREKYENMDKDQLIDMLINIEKDVKRVF